jgi:hypothetical protein
MVAGCVLALQVLLTRLFSAALFYHFSFLSISLALLGAGAGAIAVYVRPRWFDRRPLEQELAAWAVVLAALLLVIPVVLARIRFGTSDQVTGTFAALLALTSVVTTLLFAAAGIVIALAVRGYTATMSRLYAFDLGGAALGAVVVVPLMWIVGVPTLIVALAPVAALAALVFVRGRGGLAGAAAGLLVVGLLAAILAAGHPSAASWDTALARAIASPDCTTTAEELRSRATTAAGRCPAGATSAWAPSRSATCSAAGTADSSSEAEVAGTS